MKKIVLSIFLSIIAIAVNAKNEGVYSITQEIKAMPGQQVTMVVNFNNTIKFSGIQMKLKLPDGVEVAYDENDAPMLTLNQRAKGFYAGVTFNPATRLYFIDISHDSKGIEPSEGEIFSLTVNVGKNAKLGTQNMEFTACEFADMDAETTYVQDDFNVPFIIYDLFSVSATSADEKMGSVTIEPAGDAVESGTTITATATANDGYSFVNWTTGAVDSKDNPYNFELTENTALTANFKAIAYPVVFKNDEAEVQKGDLDFASVITAPENPTKVGHTFLGWYAGETLFVEGATVPLNGITYEAKWQINQYTITFDTDGGSEVAAITQDYASDITAPENPTKTGYTFKGWDKEIPATMPAENTTIKATWTINKYTVKFVADEKVVSEETLDYGTAITAPEVPAKEGHTGAWVDVAETVPAEDVTYTAVYTPINYTITFDTDGGSEVAAITLPYGSAIKAPEKPTKTGYTFERWDSEIPATMPAKDKTITAIWTINSYVVKFVADDAVVSEKTLEYGSAITAPEVPAKEGHTGAWVDVAETVPAEDVTYTAVYTPINYTITFDTDGGSEVAAITLPYGSAIKAPEKPTKTGYTFERWDSEIPATMPAKDKTITAIWTINSYDVKYVVDGVVVSEETLEYGTEIKAPAVVPSKPGWVFLGWESEYTGTTVPDYDVTYTAQWKQDIITLRFVFWDDNKVEYQYKPGEEITEIPEVPAREGYTFKGWDKTIPEVMPEDVDNGVLVITANWSVNKYVVYFIANGKTVKKQTMTYGSPIVAPEAPEVEGYTFVGWTPEVAETVPANNVWYEAVYEVNTYTVTYYVNGEVVNVAEVKYGEEIPAYEPTVEEGMKFDGWQEEIPAVMPATNLEIHGTTSGIETAIKNIVAKFGETFDVYNVSGRLVQRVNGASDITRIPAGMYIINGTKVVIRKD